MAVIKFDKEKAKSLIKDLGRISSDIELNLKGIGESTIGKQISLTDSRLKVFGYRDKIIEMVQPDDTIVQEIVKEKFLKSDYTLFARTFNSLVKGITARSESSRSNTSKAIGEVVNSLLRIVALVEEFENDSSLRMANSLDAVGQYNFNFLAPHGPSNVGAAGAMAGAIAALVAEEALPSDLLGPLGERPSIIDLAKLAIFDDVFDIAFNNKDSMEEKIARIGEILISEIDKDDDDNESLFDKSRKAFEDMRESFERKREKEKIKENEKVEYLINHGVKVIQPLVSTAGVAIASGINAVGQAILQNKPVQDKKEAVQNMVNEILDKKPDIKENVVNAIKDAENKISDKLDDKKVEAIKLDKVEKELIEDSNIVIEKAPKEGLKNVDKMDIDQSQQNDIVTDVKYEEVKLSAEDIALEEELRVSNITATYDTSSVTESTNIGEVDVPVEDVEDIKGAGVVAGAAGIGALGKLASSSPSSASAPAMGGMSAGEMLGINRSGNDVMSTPVMGTTTASTSGASNTTTTNTTKSTVGGESTSDRGASNNANSSDKTTSGKSSGKGSTLEDKKQEDEENTYGKPNKTDDLDKNNEKGMLGDASIAELNAKDEKQIKIATGVSAGVALGSVVLAVAGIMPSFLLILLLLLIVAVYTTYRVKKKMDKKKRIELLAQQKVEKVDNNVSLSLADVQNVSDIAVNDIEEQQPDLSNDAPSDWEQHGSDEFSEQPYEPSRDGATEIGVSSDKTE